MRLTVPFTLFMAVLAFVAPLPACALGAHSPLSRHISLYHTLQQRLAKPGDITDEGYAGLQLLLAQLYSEMGMLLAAQRTLDGLQGGRSIMQLKDMGRLLLARQYRMRGELGAAREQLTAISSGLDPALEHERQQMLALSAYERGNTTEALQRFGRVQQDEGAVLLARFNYAALLLSGMNVDHGRILLHEIASSPATGAAVAALRDRASLLLGYHYLRQQQFPQAHHQLSRVRLSGPYSREALLALGWAELEISGAEAAIAPWMELLAFGKDDSLDEEARLAVAAAIASRGPTQRAVHQYRRLLDEFAEKRKLVVSQRQQHLRSYPPDEVETVLQSDDEEAQQSLAGVVLSRLLRLRKQLFSYAANSPVTVIDESLFYERLWAMLHELYPTQDEHAGIDISVHVARITESFIRSLRQQSIRVNRPTSSLAQRLDADRATLNSDIAVVAEWYRQSRLAALEARNKRLDAYEERARLAIARSHDLAMRQQERD